MVAAKVSARATDVNVPVALVLDDTVRADSRASLAGATAAGVPLPTTQALLVSLFFARTRTR